jgi:hypothetical protein
MNISVQRVKVGIHMGDHAQDVVTMHEVGDGETVEALASRLLTRERWVSKASGLDPEEPMHEWHIIIRLTEPAP